MKINIKVSHKLAVSFLLVIARHAQSTQNSNFVISLQYLKKEGRDELYFLHAGKHQTLSFITFDVENFYPSNGNFS